MQDTSCCLPLPFDARIQSTSAGCYPIRAESRAKSSRTRGRRFLIFGNLSDLVFPFFCASPIWLRFIYSQRKKSKTFRVFQIFEIRIFLFFSPSLSISSLSDWIFHFSRSSKLTSINRKIHNEVNNAPRCKTYFHRREIHFRTWINAVWKTNERTHTARGVPNRREINYWQTSDWLMTRKRVNRKFRNGLLIAGMEGVRLVYEY